MADNTTTTTATTKTTAAAATPAPSTTPASVPEAPTPAAAVTAEVATPATDPAGGQVPTDADTSAALSDRVVMLSLKADGTPSETNPVIISPRDEAIAATTAQLAPKMPDETAAKVAEGIVDEHHETGR